MKEDDCLIISLIQKIFSYKDKNLVFYTIFDHLNHLSGYFPNLCTV
jgi:hypothetical protein